MFELFFYFNEIVAFIAQSKHNCIKCDDRKKRKEIKIYNH